ncbi:MAG: porin, partial [Salaquimonas sp.]
MKIKSLLLGSAAAMIAVSGAQAADAIIVEPEPMEYVKVCDMYGAGFFYIPGTETCMNINGFVRSTYIHREETIDTNLTVAGLPVTAQVTTGGFFGGFTNGTTSAGAAAFAGPFRLERNTSSWNIRGRLNFDVRNETEYGTLRSELRLQGGDAGTSGEASGRANVAIDRALISLAGFRLGYSDTYWTTNHGYGAGTPAINDGFYDFDQAIFFDYTATLMDGVSVTVGVQDSNGGSFGASSPDIYVGMNASFGGLTLAATAIRDDYIDPITGISEDEWAYKGSAILDIGQSGWQVGGWYAKDDGHTQYVTGYFSRDIDEQWGVQVNGAVA